MATGAAGRVVRGIRQQGPIGLLRIAFDRARRRVWLDEAHIWYVLGLDRVKSRPLADGYELRRGGPDDLQALADARAGPPIGMAARRLDDGAQLWLATAAGAIAFACWIFEDFAPVLAARDGQLLLPAAIACLEDSFTIAAHRGRGIAAAAWTAIAAGLAGQGRQVLITKVEVENVPSRRAVEKAGFVGAGEMRLRRRGLRTVVTVTPCGAELTEAEDGALAMLQGTLRH
ncbi:MAG: hypothetical protein QOI10_1529 [Solirubrobacterales bacterium]|jgi:GNAT superfamily N-acetyltransferase|nr:hypothetical protein [Solirubrobacterales bacterium]